MDRRISFLSLVVVGVAVLSLTACSSTVQLAGDYPSYDERGLVDEATLIVEATALSAKYTVLTPRYEGTTPEENPLLGFSDDEKRRAIDESDGIAVTVVTLRIDDVYKGAAQAGRSIEIVQTGGVIDGTTYVADDEPALVTGEHYLLFATDSFDGAFVILGGSAGMFTASGGDNFTPVNPDVAPFSTIHRSELERLIE